MGFCLQLRLLLWKNFTLKRRRPVVLMFELIIPLVLFIILVGIRSKQPAQNFPSQHFPVWPLPSAGLISVMQAFCDSGETDQYGFFKNSNATATDFLSKLNSVAENNNFFQPKFTLDELNEIPRIYRSIVEDPISVKEAFDSKSFEMRPRSLFKNIDEAENFFIQDLSFGPDSVQYVFRNTSVNKTKLYSLLFHYPLQTSMLFEQTASNEKSSPSADDLAFVAKNVFEVVENHESLLQPQPNNNKIAAKMFGSLNEGIFHTYLKNNLEFQKRFLEVVGGNLNYSMDDSLSLVKETVMDTFLMDIYVCTGQYDTYYELILCDQDGTQGSAPTDPHCKMHLKKFYEQFCNLGISEKLQLHEFLMKELNTTLLSRGAMTDWNYKNLRTKIERLAKDLNTFVLFKKTVRLMAKLASSLPHKYCNASDTKENTNKAVPTEKDDLLKNVDLAGAESIMLNRDTVAESQNNQNNGSKITKTAKKKPNLPYALLKIWKSMQKTVCGEVFEFEEEDVNSLKDMGLSKVQMEKLELLIHVLYNNPKVLYTPTGTQADLVVQKANATFILFDKINQYAKRILEVGKEIKDFLNSKKTEMNLIILREIQNDIVRSPFYTLLFAQPAVQEFLSDPDIANKKSFLKEIDTIMLAACSWQELMEGLNFNIFKGFRTEDEMLTYFKTRAYFDNITVLAGVVFHMNNDGSLPNHMIYKIRQNASLTIDTKRIRNRFWFPGPRVWGYNYYYFGFVWVQDILERAMISLYAERDVTSPGTYLQQFPYPCYIRDQFLFMIQHVMPLCLTISWVYSVAILVQHIVYEKEQRLKEVMKMMGLKNGVLWIAWFLTSFSQMTVTIGILTLVLKYGKVLTYSNPWIVFLTMESFSVAIIMFSFLVSALYSKAKLAAACAGIIYFMSYVPYMYIAVKEESAHEIVPAWLKAVASLLAPTAFGLGAKYFAFYEEIGVGIQWDNINVSPAESDKYNLAAVVVMLMVDAVYYGVIFWYIENIHPGAFGLPRPWYFPLQKSYWLGYDSTEESPSSPTNESESKGRSKILGYFTSVFVQDGASSGGGEQEQPSNDNIHNFNQLYEADQLNLIMGVSIADLSKRYKGSRKYALKDLNLNLYEGQITALLGHNGAGKTTTMSILTGLFPPTSGHALIYGHDIRFHMDLIRRSLGMCPQHNVLFDDLTLEEHMWFYSRLKGQGFTDFDSETNKLIADLKLPNKRFQKVSTLSGGMKRKLSVAIAFVGGSKTVILDEPTAGVDPYARRAIWDLIIKYKKGRTILLSTHHMDEADILGDKIAIMESGRLKCCGSPLYLKNHLGEGYHLCIVKTLNDEETSITSRCSQREVTEAIQKIVPTVRLVNESKHELHYMLPLSELRRGNFVPLFQYLSNSRDQLFISSFGVKNTTLEEVFIRVISERRNSDTSSDKDIRVAPPGGPSTHSLMGSRNHSRQASLGNASTIHSRCHSRQVSKDLNQAFGAKHHSRHNSSDIQVTKFIQGHSRQSSDVNAKELTSLPLLGRQVHARQSSRGGGGVVLSVELERKLKLLASGGPGNDSHGEKTEKNQTNPNNIEMTEATTDDNKNPNVSVNVNSAVNKKDLLSEINALTSSIEEGDETKSEEIKLTLNPMDDRVNQIPMKELTSTKPISKQVSVNFIEKVQQPRIRGQGTLSREKDSCGGAGEDILTEPKSPPSNENTAEVTVEMLGTHYIQGKKSLLLQQFWALLCKRYLFTRKNIEGIFSQILLPAFFVSVAMSVALTSPAYEELTEMMLSPSQFYNISPWKGNVIPFANNKLDLAEINSQGNDADSSQIASTLSLPSGIGATCVLNHPFMIQNHNLSYWNHNGQDILMHASDFDTLCAEVFSSKKQSLFFVKKSKNARNSIPASRERKYPICTCNDDNTGFVCPSYGYTDPEMFELVSRDTLVDISGQNESQYYLHTTDMFRLTRYGGLSFGLVNRLVPPEFGKSSPSAFRKVAVRHAAKIWFNNQGFHSIPIFVNAMNNAILRANLPPEKGTPAAYGITVINHPFPNSQTIFSQDEILQGNDVLIAIFIIVAMSFVPASFVLFLVYERASKAKHLQIISGVHRIVYWVANYIWDILNYTVPAAFCVVILLIFDIPAYTSSKNLPAVVSLFLMYGWSITPVMYPASFVFKDPSSAYISLIVGNLFVGITCIVTSFLLEVFSYDAMLSEVHLVLKYIFLVFPNYCLGRGLMDIAFNEYYNQFLLNTGQYHKVKSPFAWDIISKNLVAMATTGITFFVITLLCEYNFFRKPRTYKKFIGAHKREEEDADVFNEKKRVARGSADEDILSVQGLSKVFHSRKTGKHLVVDQLSWGIPAGECFGLLGVNGAGKSSTFRMLTGDTRITNGDALINGFSVKNELHSVYKFIGYCPQFDALYDELSAREHLNLYATLRGVLEKSRPEIVDWAMTKLDLNQYADRPVGTYSGGNKRKVSTAIALIGGPSLIFLDEPTTGMDPYSKRFLWDLILSLVEEGKSIVFTSHSMEECEVLCTRLAIMVNGRFKCLGSTQHLKNKFGDGYSVKVKTLESDTWDIEQYMKKSFPFAVLKEKHYNSLHYELNSQYVFLDDIFNKMEGAMKEVYIQDYSVSQNTLDNVFINFVKDQNDQWEIPQASLAEPELELSSDVEYELPENYEEESDECVDASSVQGTVELLQGNVELLPDIVP